MATKKSKANNSKKETNENPFYSLLIGWFLLIIGVIILLGIISNAVSGDEENWLGRLFGTVIPVAVTYIFGKLPVILFSLSLMLWGVSLSLPQFRKSLFRFALGTTLLVFNSSFLLSLKLYAAKMPSGEEVANYGGALGLFFSRNIAIPIFGTTSAMAPALVLIATLLLILIIAFGLRPRHFDIFVRGAQWFASLFHKREKVEEPVKEDVVEDAPKSKNLLVDDNTIYTIPDGYNIQDKGGVKPFKASRKLQNALGDTTFDVDNFKLEDNPYGDDFKDEVPVKPIENEIFDEDDTLDEDPEILRLQNFLRENRKSMNSLEILQIRQKIADLRVARDKIKWEEAHNKNRMVVKGTVKRDEEDTKEVTQIAEEKTLVYADSAEEETVAFMPEVHASFEEENTEEHFESESLDTLDEIEENLNEEYTPPNQIGTSSGIPQPSAEDVYDEYKIPAISEILNEHEVQQADYTEEELNAIGKMLEEKLENFQIKGKVVGCETGPVITRFEVEPGPGVKVSKFSALQDDLAMALKAMSIRILAPIPGKGAVGIEIPNRKTQTIYGKDIFDNPVFEKCPDKIIMAIGKDISGEPFVMDLAKAPHLMIAGQTGSGKSVCINSLMASMLFSKTPDELRMILVDPKAVELKMYENIPHLLAPVITKPEVAIQALQWLCFEMDRRTEVLAKAKVRNLLGFNEKFEAGELPEEVPDEDRNHRMAFIVVIIDEMADLMMVAGKEIEKSVSRLAAKARAVGIHLVLATQRPSVKVITGNIKANLPTRISFKVASQVDARTVMDHAGAERLLGRGDMLYKAVNSPDPIRVHGAFLSDEEAEKLADACSNQNVYYPQLDTFETGEEGEGEDGGAKEKVLKGKIDPLLLKIAQKACEMGSEFSTTWVQRAFEVGFSRAGRIVDSLHALGFCSAKNGSKPRKILMSFDELQEKIRLEK